MLLHGGTNLTRQLYLLYRIFKDCGSGKQVVARQWNGQLISISNGAKFIIYGECTLRNNVSFIPSTPYLCMALIRLQSYTWSTQHMAYHISQKILPSHKLSVGGFIFGCVFLFLVGVGFLFVWLASHSVEIRYILCHGNQNSM